MPPVSVFCSVTTLPSLDTALYKLSLSRLRRVTRIKGSGAAAAALDLVFAGGGEDSCMPEVEVDAMVVSTHAHTQYTNKMQMGDKVTSRENLIVVRCKQAAAVIDFTTVTFIFKYVSKLEQKGLGSEWSRILLLLLRGEEAACVWTTSSCLWQGQQQARSDHDTKTRQVARFERGKSSAVRISAGLGS